MEKNDFFLFTVDSLQFTDDYFYRLIPGLQAFHL